MSKKYAAVSIGVMDGVHRGHLAVVEKLIATARRHQSKAVVITFEPHPKQILTGAKIAKLCSLEQRRQYLKNAGVDEIAVVPFDREVAALDARQFIESYVIPDFELKALVLGYDNRFGRRDETDGESIESLSDELGFEIVRVPRFDLEGQAVSSSAIRRLLAEGKVQTAHGYLGRPYMMSGQVVQGEQRGRLVGFPTANLDWDADLVLPAPGVYAVKVNWRESVHDGMMNIGNRPTFGGTRLTMEVHILDFDTDIYGETLEVEFFERLRSERKFGGLEDLRRQLSADKDRCMAILRGLV